MAVRLRFARYGCRNRPFYRIIAANSGTRRDGKHLEIVGHFDPLTGKDGSGKQMAIKFDRVKYWLSVGSQPSKPVQRLLLKAGMFPPSPVISVDRKGGSQGTSEVDPWSGSLMVSGQSTAIEIPADADATTPIGKYEPTLHQLVLFICIMLFWGVY